MHGTRAKAPATAATGSMVVPVPVRRHQEGPTASGPTLSGFVVDDGESFAAITTALA